VFPSDAFTKKSIKSSKTLNSPAEGEGEALTEAEGLAEAEGEALAETDLEAEADGDLDAEELLLGLGDALTLALGLWEGLCETEADWECVPPNSPSSLRACPAERESLAFLISQFDKNFAEPLPPISISLEDPMPPWNFFTT